MKSRDGKSQREKRRRKKIKKRKSQKKEIQVREKVGKSRNTVFFQWFMAPEGRTVGSLKRAGAEPAGQMRDEKLHAVVARSTFRSQNVTKTHQVRTTFGSWDVEKVHVVVARSTFRSKHVKNITCSDHFWRSDVVSRGSISKNDGRRGAFEEDLQRCIFRGRRSARDIFIRAVRRSGRWFPEKGCSLEHQIFRFAEMILRDRCSTSYVFRGRRSSLDRWNRKTHWHEAVSSALNFPFLKDISQNCFVFDVVNLNKWGRLAELFRFDVVKLKNWGRLAELFGFWRCQVQNSRKSRRIAAFSSLRVDRQTGRQTDR